MEEGSYPKLIILPTKDIVETFKTKTKGLINQIDHNEIMTQIIQVMMNDTIPNENNYDEENFLDINRLRDRRFSMNEVDLVFVHSEAYNLLQGIEHCLTSQNAFLDGDFPYIFDSFLINDVILKKLPF